MTEPLPTNTEGAPRRPFGRDLAVAGLTAAMVAVGLGLYFLVGLATTGSLVSGVTITWWMLAVGFLAAEVFVVHVHFRAETHTFSLSEFVLVLGLFFSPSWQVLVGELIGAMLSLALHRRQTISKLAFNLAQFFLTTTVAITIFRAFANTSDDPVGPRSWAAAFVALIVADLLSGLVVTAAIWATDRERPSLGSIGDLFRLGTLATVATISLGLVAVVLLNERPETIILFATPIALLLVAFRAVATERQRSTRVDSLYQSMQQLHGVAELQAAVVSLLDEARWLFRADMAQVVLIDGTSAISSRLGPGDSRDIMRSVDTDRLGPELRGGSVLVPEGQEVERTAALGVLYAKDAMMTRLVTDGKTIGSLLVASRLGDVDTFGQDDLRLLETYASHVVLAIEKGRLQRSLTEMASESERLELRALTDPLTGLGNRAMLTEKLERALSPSAPGQTVGVLFIDLDDFKQVNDTLGHDAGDLLLITVAERLRNCLRPHDTPCRPGGDEFVVLLEHFDVTDEPALVADRIAAALAAPVRIEGTDILIKSSIGIAVGTSGEIEAAELLAHADTSMYRAKSKGKNRREIFEG
jgi:diguanylate cyclase (GGDEF)-like protein